MITVQISFATLAFENSNYRIVTFLGRIVIFSKFPLKFSNLESRFTTN